MKKQVLSALLAIVLVVGIFTCFAFTTNAAPETDYTGYYKITNAGQLSWFACLVVGDTSQSGITEADPDAKAVLTADIDITVLAERFGKTWSGIGTADTPFTGVFDGNGYTIKGLTIDSTLTTPTVATVPVDTVEQGLFGVIGEGGVVRDVVLQGTASVSDGMKLGAVASVNNGTIENVLSMMTVTGGTNPDAFVHTNNGTITNCYTNQTGTATGATKVTADALANGSVAYALGASFGQTLGTDTVPVHYTEGNAVYKIDETTYSNEAPPVEAFVATLDELKEALANDADIITLTADITTDEVLVIDSSVTINGDGFIVTGSALKVFEVQNATDETVSVTMNELNIVNTAAKGRGVDIRNDAIALTLTNCTVTAQGVNAQPITVGGSDTGTVSVTLDGTSLDAGKSGYAIISFLPAEICVKDSDTTDAYPSSMEGYGCIYLKETAQGSTVTVSDTVITSINSYDEPSNNFGAIVPECDGVTITVDSSSKINITATGDANQSVVALGNLPATTSTASSVTIESPITLTGENAVYTYGTATEEEITVTYTDPVVLLDMRLKTLEADVTELNKLIAEGGTIDAIIEKVDGITATLAALDDTYATDEQLKTAVDDANKALTEAINTVQANLDKAVEDLTKAIEEGDKVNADEIVKQVGILTEMINKVESESIARDDALTEALDEAKTTLTEAINTIQANLDKAVEDLTKAIKDGDDALAAEIVKQVGILTEMINKVESESIARDDALTEALDEAKKTLTEAINTVQENLNKAVEDLTKAIKDGDDALAAEIVKQVGILTEMINKVESESIARDDALTKALEEAKAELEEAIKALREYLELEMNKLAAAMQAADKELSTRLAAAVESLSTVIATVEKESIARDEALSQTLAEAKATLEAAIKTVQANLDKAVADLNKAIKDGDTALSDKLTALDNALKTAESTLKAADTANKTALSESIEAAKTELTALIANGDQTTKDALLAEIEKLRSEMADADKSNKTLTIILSVVAILGVVAVLVVVLKKK